MALSLHYISSGNFFNNFLVENSSGSHKSYLTNPDYAASHTTISAVIGVLTVAIIVSIVLATALFYYKQNPISKIQSFFRNRVGAIKKISQKFDHIYSFSSDEGEFSSSRSETFHQQNSDRESPAPSGDDDIQYTNVSIAR